MTREDEIERGHQARQVLEHPLYQEALTQIRQEITEAWMKSRPGEAEKREALYLMRGLLDRLELHLKSAMETGRLAMFDPQDMSRQATGTSTLLPS